MYLVTWALHSSCQTLAEAPEQPLDDLSTSTISSNAWTHVLLCSRYLTGYSVSSIFTSISRIGVILVVGSMLLCGVLHGDGLAFAGAFLPYWIFQPVFWNILQVGRVLRVAYWASQVTLQAP